MKALIHVLRLAILVCLAALLIAALPQVAFGLVLALLVPFWFFIAVITAVLSPVIDELFETRPFPCLPVFSPRPPPIT